jgi:hypothetical protein
MRYDWRVGEKNEYREMPKAKKLKVFPGLILTNREPTLRLSELCRELPREPEYKTLWSWCVRGRSHPYNRKRVHMEALQSTFGIVSSIEAYYRFLERLNDA